jgi:hypothetical protein
MSSSQWCSSTLGLVYLLVRMLVLAGRQREIEDRLIPVLSVRGLAVLLVLLVAVRLVYPVFDDRPVIDVGQASVIGADRIAHGEELYDRDSWGVLNHPDTYGPLIYIAYLPFEQIFPYSLPDHLAAARAAAAAFDLLTVVGLLVLGRRLRKGEDGTALGVVLAFAWASYPYTSFVLLRGLRRARRLPRRCPRRGVTTEEGGRGQACREAVRASPRRTSRRSPWR